MSARIVFVDDDPMTAKVMRWVFEDEGYEAVTLTRGSLAYGEVIGRDTKLVVLDVNLPDINGFSLCEELRARRYYGPVVFLTGRSDLDDKLKGLRMADDYIVKPFEPLELIARVESVIRRYKPIGDQSLGTILRVEDAELSIGELTYTSDDIEPVVLTPTEMRILEFFMRNARIVISRERLIERIWDYDLEGDTNRVDVYIRRARKKIEKDPTNPKYLHTVRGVGYVFRPGQYDGGHED